MEIIAVEEGWKLSAKNIEGISIFKVFQK